MVQIIAIICDWTTLEKGILKGFLTKYKMKGKKIIHSTVGIQLHVLLNSAWVGTKWGINYCLHFLGQGNSRIGNIIQLLNTLMEAVRHFRSVVIDADSRVTTAHAHQCCTFIFQSYAKTVPSRMKLIMKLTMREPASMTTDTWSRRVTFYSNGRAANLWKHKLVLSTSKISIFPSKFVFFFNRPSFQIILFWNLIYVLKCRKWMAVTFASVWR